MLISKLTWDRVNSFFVNLRNYKTQRFWNIYTIFFRNDSQSIIPTLKCPIKHPKNLCFNSIHHLLSACSATKHYAICCRDHHSNIACLFSFCWNQLPLLPRAKFLIISCSDLDTIKLNTLPFNRVNDPGVFRYSALSGSFPHSNLLMSQPAICKSNRHKVGQMAWESERVGNNLTQYVLLGS